MDGAQTPLARYGRGSNAISVALTALKRLEPGSNAVILKCYFSMWCDILSTCSTMPYV